MINKCTNDFDTTQINYLNEIKNNQPLTKMEEMKLFKKYKMGDLSARNKLIESNLRFVVKVAKDFRGKGLSYSDLISEGNAGLIKALEKYDPKYDVKLFSYGVWWIRQYMQDAIKRNYKNSYDRIDDIIIGTENQPHTDDESYYDLEPIKVYKSMNDYSDNVFRDNNDEMLISELVNTLDSREKFIIEDYFGLKDGNELTLEEIGCKYGLTKERVRQIKEKSLTRMRSNFLKDSNKKSLMFDDIN